MNGPVMKMEPLNNLQVMYPLHFCSIIIHVQYDMSVVLLSNKASPWWALLAEAAAQKATPETV